MEKGRGGLTDRGGVGGLSNGLFFLGNSRFRGTEEERGTGNERRGERERERWGCVLCVCLGSFGFLVIWAGAWWWVSSDSVGAKHFSARCSPPLPRPFFQRRNALSTVELPTTTDRGGASQDVFASTVQNQPEHFASPRFARPISVRGGGRRREDRFAGWPLGWVGLMCDWTWHLGGVPSGFAAWRLAGVIPRWRFSRCVEGSLQAGQSNLPRPLTIRGRHY